MTDLISREAAIEAVYQGLKKPSNDETLQRILDNLKQIPVIDCAQQWIPVSEMLPNDDKLKLVTYKDQRTHELFVWIGWHEMDNVWYIDGETHSAEYGNDVVAWQPRPKPYEEVSE